MDELKPCPFCGSQAVIKRVAYSCGFYVTCGNHHCYVVPVTYYKHTRHEAIAAWNRREGGQDDSIRTE